MQILTLLIESSRQYFGSGKFHPYACINERSAKNKIFEVLGVVKEEKFEARPCNEGCDEYSLVISDTRDENNDCYCIGDKSRRNISLFIHPSDIMRPLRRIYTGWNCDDGMGLHCRIDADFNWCTLLDDSLSHYDFHNKFGHPEVYYKNFYPKCLDHKSFHPGTLHKNQTVDGISRCHGICHDDQYFALKVRTQSLFILFYSRT